MIRIILQALELKNINQPTVYKPTGEKPYKLCNKLPLYENDNDKERVQVTINMPETVMFLASDSGINVINTWDKVALEFENVKEAADFLNELNKQADIPF